MSDVPTPENKRRDARYPVLHNHSCHIEVERRNDQAEAEIIEGELLDLSRGGAKLRVAAFLPFSQVVRLRVRIPEVSIELDVTTEVCWTRRDDVNAWLVGCSFNPPIDEDTLQQLAVNSLIERRHTPRTAMSSEATLLLQSSNRKLRVRLRDVSAGGFCMSCSVAVPVGDKVRIVVPSTDRDQLTITGRVCWTLKSDDGHLVGCAAVASSDYQVFRDSICQQPSATTDSYPASSKSRRRVTVGVATLAALVLGTVMCADYRSDLASSRSRVAAALADHPVSVLEPTDVQENLVDALAIPDERQLSPRDRDPISGAMSGRRLTPITRTPLDHSTIAPVAQDDSTDSQWNLRDESETIELRPKTRFESRPPRDLPLDENSLSDPVARKPRSVLNKSSEALHEQQTDSKSTSTAGQATRDSTPGLPNRKEPDTPRSAFERRTQVNSAQRPDPVIDSLRVGPSKLDDGRVPASPKLRSVAVLGRDVKTAPGPGTLPDQSGEKTDSASQAFRAFTRGDRAYRTGQYSEATEAFQAAVKNDPRNPFYYYVLALAQWQAGQRESAAASVLKAVSLERIYPISNKGQRLLRYQGEARLWLETQRTKVLSSHKP